MQVQERILKPAIKHPETGKLYVAQTHKKARALSNARLGENRHFYNESEGFVTSLRRFVGRKEAAAIAFTAGQTDTKKFELMSHHLPSSYEYDY
jgi:hypothetical protein